MSPYLGPVQSTLIYLRTMPFKILEHAKSQNCFQKNPRQRLFKDTLIARQRLHRRDRVETAVSADLVWSREMRVRRSIFRRGDIFMALELSYALNLITTFVL